MRCALALLALACLLGSAPIAIAAPSMTTLPGIATRDTAIQDAFWHRHARHCFYRHHHRYCR